MSTQQAVRQPRPGDGRMTAAGNDFDRALTLHRANRLDEAARAYRHVLVDTPDQPDVLHLLGLLHLQRGEHDDARGLIEKAAALRPELADYQFHLGEVHRGAGDMDAAIDHYRRALEIAPCSAAAHVAMANAQRSGGRALLAVTHARAAIEADPGRAEAYNELALALRELDDLTGAIEAFRQGLKADNGNPALMVNLAKALAQSGDDRAAATAYRAVVAREPGNVDARLGLGNALRASGDVAAATGAYRDALALNPRDGRILSNLGVALQQRGQLGEAARHLEAAVAAAPSLPEAHKNLAMLHLLRGDLAAGFEGYEWRWREAGRINRARPFTQPAWDGAPLAGKTLLAWGEQAVGEEIMFASVLPDVIAAAEHCVVECEPRLVPLFARSFPEAEVIARRAPPDPRAEAGDIDTQCATGGLCRWLRRDFSSFPETRGYLTADPERTAVCRERYAALGSGLKVGIAWRGGDKRFRVDRSIDLEQWRDLLTTPGIQFVNLQYGERRADLDHMRAAFGVDVFDDPDIDQMQSLDDFAAQIAALDLVVSIDNTTVHMAGALGVPVWTILAFAADWRWFTDRDDSPWYPSMRLFRQRHPDDWRPVFTAARGALAVLVARHAETDQHGYPR